MGNRRRVAKSNDKEAKEMRGEPMCIYTDVAGIENHIGGAAYNQTLNQIAIKMQPNRWPLTWPSHNG